MPRIRFKIGDLITCTSIEHIDGSICYGITKGRTYKVLSVDYINNPLIKNDGGISANYSPHRFKLVTREEKLKRILK